MVDLQGQYQRLKAEIDKGIQGVLDSSIYVKGPVVKQFEDNLAKYLGAKHVISCANGTDALQIAFMALELEPGDEVITPSHTYVATVEVLALLRLKPVFVEVDAHTFTMDTDSLRKAITPKTKAVVPVHLYGQCANMEEILTIAQEHNLYVVEDNAQAIGAEYTFKNGTTKKSGTMGHIGCTSFFPSKNLGCYGDGGAINTNDDTLAKKIRMIANHGQEETYYHDLVGVNSRLDAIQAAVLDVKLKYLNDFAARRNRVAAIYDSWLRSNENVIIPHRASYSTHVFHQYTLVLKNGSRDEVRKKLADEGIPTMVYYPLPVHLQKAYYSNEYANGLLKHTEELSQKVISLPIHTEFKDDDVKYVAETFLNSLKN